MNKDYILFLGFMLVLLATSVPLGKYLAKVYQLKPVVGDKIFLLRWKMLYTKLWALTNGKE